MKNILKVVLLITAVGLSYAVYRTVQGYVEFHKKKVDRYADAVEQLKDVALAENFIKFTRENIPII